MALYKCDYYYYYYHHSFEYFENNFTDFHGWLSFKVYARADPNMGDLCNRTPQNWGGIGVESGAQKNLQYLRNGAR